MVQARLQAFKGQGPFPGIIEPTSPQRLNGHREHTTEPFTDITSLEVSHYLVSPLGNQLSIQEIGQFR